MKKKMENAKLESNKNPESPKMTRKDALKNRVILSSPQQP